MKIASRDLESKKIIILGGGVGGESVILELERRLGDRADIIGILDDDPEKLGKEIAGVRVIGRTEDLKKISEETGADLAIIAIPSASGKNISRMVNLCSHAGVDYRIVPGIYDLMTGHAVISSPIRKVHVEDLIKRDAATIDVELVRSTVKGKRILITGGAGSIGSEIVSTIVQFSPEKVFVLDTNENTTMELLWQLRDGRKMKEGQVVPVIGDILNRDKMEILMSEMKPDIIYHAAAKKHVPLMELYPEEAVETNVIGTKNLLEIAERNSVETFVLISTDKAVNPVNVMGATKRMAELLVKEYSSGEMHAISVRFGNVLGSAGSVIPLFRKQIEEGGPVTVTDPEIRRFFMTIPEAASLVIQASAFKKRGNTYVLEMGEQIKVLDLAKEMMELAGFVPSEDIDIKFTGLRPGEKMFEELYYEYEKKEPTSNPGIFSVSSEKRWKTYVQDIEEMSLMIKTLDRKALIEKIMSVVPEFVPQRTTFDEKVGGIV